MNSTMGSLVIPFLLVLATGTQLQGKASAHLDSESELAELKDLLERLEDKLEAGEREAELDQSFNEPSDTMVGDASQDFANWESKYGRPMSEGSLGRNWHPPERSSSTTRDKLRALFNTPRSLQRSSSCFGQRLDRIGSSSGLGCNRNRN